jgi:hypothetical protein
MARFILSNVSLQKNNSHNNGTVYKGTLGIDGGMSGFGTYTFIDTSVLEANWDQNKPVADIILKEPLGSVWKGVYDGKVSSPYSTKLCSSSRPNLRN